MEHMNHLKNETSPYLLQHAANPVDWYPWCGEAFMRAKTENKPIFLSIGYSTCHWCHVMAHESFENEKIAQSLNDAFICIKVDREERPDLDHVYMQACQLMTGSGGWPMSVFLTPGKKPFFAGTYFPPSAFLKLIKILSAQWKANRDELLKSAAQIEAAMHTASHAQDGSIASAPAPDLLLKDALEYFRASFDPVNGGFGTAPKFPSPHNLMLLLATAPQMAEKTLLQMYKGGIFDHIGGGFSRYSTDDKWLAPHFEKMLYDNALLAIAYTLAYAKTQSVFFRYVAERTLHYLMREMRSPEGGFYTAQDADTDGEEGKYYLFTPKETDAVLGNDAKAFCARYDITNAGNFEGKSIPNLLKSAAGIEIAEAGSLADIAKYGAATSDGGFLAASAENTAFAEDLQKLYEYRKDRASLHRDEKILTGWNSLAAAAFAFAGRIFKNEELIFVAEKTMDFIQDYLTANGMLFASFSPAKKSIPAFLDDYAFYTLALIQTYHATQNSGYLSQAIGMATRTIEQFWDEKDHGFFFSGKENETLITAVKETYDGAIPSANAVMSYNLMQLAKNIENGKTHQTPTGVLAQLKDILCKHNDFMDKQSSIQPAGHGFYLFARFPLKETDCRGGICRLTGEDVF